MPRKEVPAPPSVDDVATLLMQWSALAMRAARAETMPEILRLMSERNLSMPMVVVLNLLAFEGTQTMTRLAERTGLSTSATSHLIQRLVEGGLVDRSERADDRRIREIVLTAAGTAFVGEMMRQRFADLRASVAPLSSSTRGVLAEAIGRVTAELAAALGAAIPGCPVGGDPLDRGPASKQTHQVKKQTTATGKKTSKERA